MCKPLAFDKQLSEVLRTKADFDDRMETEVLRLIATKPQKALGLSRAESVTVLSGALPGGRITNEIAVFCMC